MSRYERSAVWSTVALTLLIWVLRSLHWNSILDGDSALYSLMSLDVLKGQHYFYTAGQSHGGTPLVYVRAFFFWLFGVSRFTGFFLNGIVVAAAAGLWAQFAARLSGPTAAAVTGLLAALGSTIFAQYSATDYYALALLSGGLMLNIGFKLATPFAPHDEISPAKFFGLGLLAGFSFYICRFIPLYAIMALGFFLALAPGTRRALLLPSYRELEPRGRSVKCIINKLLLLALLVNTALFVPAFFTSDHFLGVNAETTLKLSVKLAIALWLLHRWQVLVQGYRYVLAFGAGSMLGMIPDFVFKHLNPAAIDRSTGLVRWSDLAPLLPDFPFLLGSNFSRPRPLTFGVAAAVAATLLIVMGFFGSSATKKRWLKIGALTSLPALASWFLIHTYMYFKIQYFYPTYYPLYLCLGLAAAATHYRKAAFALLVPIVFAGSFDLWTDLTKPNHRLGSGVFETMREWKLSKGTGDFWSTYDMMWAAKGEFILNPLKGSRFPRYYQAVTEEPRIAYIHHEGDNPPDDKKLYRVLKSADLKFGYRLEMLEKR